MTEFTVTEGRFTSEADATALAEAAGLVPLPLDLEPSGEDHWHDFASTVYVVDGSVTITVADTGQTCVLTPGCSIEAGPGLIHREEGDPYRAVVALHEDPSTLTMPVDKPPADLAS